MIKLQNRDMFQSFGSSFTKLMLIDSLPVNLKLSLTKLKRSLIDQAADVQAVNETLRKSADSGDITNEAGQSQYNELMETSFDVDFQPVSVNLIASKLSADDLFNLTPLLKEE